MNNIMMREAIEKKAGRKMETAYDFEWLAEQVEKHTHEVIGINTLKRMWGYFTGEPAKTRHSTLDVLAKYLGFRWTRKTKAKAASSSSHSTLKPRNLMWVTG